MSKKAKGENMSLYIGANNLYDEKNMKKHMKLLSKK